MSPWELGYLALCLGSLVAVERAWPERRLLPLGIAGVFCFCLGWPIGDAFGGSSWAILRLWAWACFALLPLWQLTRAVRDRAVWRRALPQALLGGVSLLLALDAFVIEPQWLEVSHHTVKSERLSRAWTIVVLADLQTDAPGAYERRALERALAEEPDLILLPGDFVQQWGDAQEPAVTAFQDLLGEVGLSAPHGVYAVGGNVELHRDWSDLFDPAVVTSILSPTRFDIAPDLAVTGLPMPEAFDTELAIARVAPFHIVFGHGPDFALGEVQADLLVAGHTHGGQVQLPFIGPLMTLSEVPRAWASGVTELPSGATLVVSRGVGMERGDAPRLRFLCRPEVVVLHLEPS